jgi:5-carboxymethyl-2-hydroxymuconate isomerase
MPHLVLEYTANVPDRPDFGELLRGLHEALAAAGPFELAKIKSRVVRHESFRAADGAPGRAFVHLGAAVLDGREPEVLRAAGDALLAVLCEAFPRARREQRCDVTLEIREMPRALYFKAPALPSQP